MLLPTPACPTPSSYVASWHSTTRTCALLVAVATAVTALLLLLFAEVVSFILALILVAYDSYVAFSNVRENSTDFETDGVSEGRSIASPSSSARRVQSRTEFAKLGNVE